MPPGLSDFPDECESNPDRCHHFCIRELVPDESSPSSGGRLRVSVRCECDAGFTLDPEDGATCRPACGEPLTSPIAYDAKTDRQALNKWCSTICGTDCCMYVTISFCSCVMKVQPCSPFNIQERFQYPNLEMAMLGYNMLRADPMKGVR